MPLTGARALQADTSWDAAVWIPAFLTALAVEAEDALDLLFAMERAWFAARAAVAGRRRNSRAARRSTSSPPRRWSPPPRSPPGSAWR